MALSGLASSAVGWIDRGGIADLAGTALKSGILGFGGKPKKGDYILDALALDRERLFGV